MAHFHLISVLAVFSFAGDWLASPAHQIRFEPIATETGIGTSKVSHVYQDRLGFLWIATQEGLAKYDGYQMRVFKHEPFDQNAPSSNDFKKIIEDQQGHIWTIAGASVNRYDRDLDRFVRYDSQDSDGIQSRPLDLFCDSRGLIWVGTVDKGIYLYNQNFDNFINYQHNPLDSSSLSNDRVTSIFESRDGTMWFGTDGGGLNRFDLDTATFTRYLYEEEDPEFGMNFGAATIPPNNGYSPIYEDENGILWIITLGGGLIKLDPKTGESVSYVHDPSDPTSLSDNLISTLFPDSRGWLWLATAAGSLDVFIPATGQFRRFRHNPSRRGSLSYGFQGPFSFAEDPWGNVWIGSEGHGIHVFNPLTEQFRHHRHEPLVDWSLPSNQISALVFDQTKTLWVGLNSGGLVKYSAHKLKFPGYFSSPSDKTGLPMAEIQTVFQDRDDQIWLGTKNQGLLLFDLDLAHVIDQYQTIAPHPGSPSIGHIYAMTQDATGDLWVGSDSGLFRIRPNAFELVHFPLPSTQIQGVHALYMDDSQRLWVGADGGDLLRFDLETETFLSFNLITEVNYWNSRITDIQSDRADGIWIAHSGYGLHHFHPESGEVQSFPVSKDDVCALSHDEIASLHTDRAGNLWVGTIGGGLQMLPKGERCFRTYTQKKHGLPSNNIYAIQEDASGKLWLTFYGGLAVFDPNQKSVQVFDAGDGLVQPSRSAHALFKNNAGQFILGGSNGINIFDPGKLSHNPQPPAVVITHFSKMGETISHELTHGQTLSLSYQDTILVFEFAALDFTYPERNQYAFYLEGFHENWVEPDIKREAMFTNLDPGEYTFKVMASNSDGVWSKTPLELKIDIAPPFWRTLWFYALEALVALLLVWSAFVYQRRRLKAQQNEALLALDLKRKTQELDYARHLQLSMLPKEELDHPAFETFGRMRTATEVGGDFYDYFRLKDNQYALAIGDATGHGFAAGLVVGMTKMSTAVWAMNQIASPQELLEEMNLGLKRSLSEKKMGMALGMLTLDLDTNRANFAFSGMPFPYHFQAETGELSPLVMKGPPLGYVGRIFVQTKQVQLAEGDYLIFLSDGFPERFNHQNAMWGAKELEACLQKCCADGLCAEAISQAAFDACDAFAAGRYHDDDMTMVILRMKSQSEVADAR